MPPADRRTALVTGATAGLGASFARQLAAQGYDVVPVARDAARLANLAATLTGEYGVSVAPLPADLSTDAGCATVEQRLRSGVDMLVNNAGMSLSTPFLRSSVADEVRLLRLNVEAVLRLTHAALPGMVARAGGDVINVSSVAGFAAVMPGSAYPASKAWVTNFSQSIASSVARHGVRVMALCPGYTRTELHTRAGISINRMPDWLWLDADDVVRVALKDLRKGKLISVPDWKYKVAVAFLRHAPTGLALRAARDTRGREKTTG